MRIFQVFLGLLWLILAVYTGIVIANHGMGLLPVFFGDMAAMAWPGQFNLDFMMFLMLSAVWTSWRHHFSPLGLLLGVIAFFGGIGFLAPYLLIASLRAKGNVYALLLGERRAAKLG